MNIEQRQVALMASARRFAEQLLAEAKEVRPFILIGDAEAEEKVEQAIVALDAPDQRALQEMLADIGSRTRFYAFVSEVSRRRGRIIAWEASRQQGCIGVGVQIMCEGKRVAVDVLLFDFKDGQIVPGRWQGVQ